jgi:hypothetical protein
MARVQRQVAVCAAAVPCRRGCDGGLDVGSCVCPRAVRISQCTVFAQLVGGVLYGYSQEGRDVVLGGTGGGYVAGLCGDGLIVVEVVRGVWDSILGMGVLGYEGVSGGRRMDDLSRCRISNLEA